MARPVLTVEHFGPGDLDEIGDAGCVVASVIADIAHHHIGDPGFWDCYGSAPEELARLKAVLDQISGAVRAARSQVAAVERRARCRANAAGRSASASTVPGEG